MGSFPAFFLRKKFLVQETTWLVLLAIFFTQLSFLPFLLPRLVEAAEITIDATVSTTASEHLFAGSQTVFLSDLVGYKFYVDSTGVCVYSKTIDGGTAWGTATTVDAQTDCTSISVWYDGWTPGDAGTNIHIGTMDTGNDDLWYNRLDTSTDTLLLGTTPVSTIINSGQVPTYVAGTNNLSITKGTDGIIYMTSQDASDSFVVSCGASCDIETNWNEVGTSPYTLGNDWSILMPLLGGGILLIDRTLTSDLIQSKKWDGFNWSAIWTTVDTAIESNTYDVGMAATLDHDTGDIFLAYGADHDNYNVLDHDLRTAKYSNGNWSVTTPLFTNTTRGLNGLAISRDVNTGDIYVAYVLRTTPKTATTGNVYYAISTASMNSWSMEQGPVNTTAGNIYGIDMNILSDERIYATWEDPTLDDIFGNTIVDLSPPTKVSKIGSPTATITAGTNGVYLGGTFVIKESQSSRNVTSVTITEGGTVDASSNLANIKLFYDLDTTAPYDCVSESYAGTETQFGVTDSNGFSGSNGVSAFTDAVGISTTQALCAYVTADVLDTANNGETIALSINNPPTDVTLSGGMTAVPSMPISFTTSSLIQNDNLTQIHYHWRNDNGNETGATSATFGVEDTVLSAVNQNSPRRLRIEVSNEGTAGAPASQFRLEYGEAAPTCTDVSSWTDVASTSDAWDMYNSTFITEGGDTINIANSIGGVTDANITFLTPNGGIRDITSQTGALTLSATNYLELEYAIVPTLSSVQGTTYCFRVTDAGTPLTTYTEYPSATVTADVTLSALGSQTAQIIIPQVNSYVGGTFVLKENASSRDVTDITITETGTVDGTSGVNNIKLFYDLDTTTPYNCVSESYAGTETQFGSTDTNGFSDINGSSTFSGTLPISTTQTACVYAVLDTTTTASNGETLSLEITNGGNDIGLSSGSISPSTPINFNSSSTLAGAIINQTHYHWRNDNGNEVGATSATLGIEDTPAIDISASSSIRLRLGIANIGLATSTNQQFKLEFGAKITTCDAIGIWTGVGDSTDDWDMHDSLNLTEGANTTNIANGSGGVTDPGGKSFIGTNAGVRDTTGTTSNITLGLSQFVELEYSLTSTAITAFDTSYCFRITNAGTSLGQYDNYAEIRTAPKRDFKTQQGYATVSGTGITLTAGVDYVAPASTSSAFVRLTGMDNTGAGKSASRGGTQNARDVTAYISNSSDLTTNFTIGRPTGAINDTVVTWEIIEFIGEALTDNEMIVREVGSLTLGIADLVATGTVLSNVTDNNKVVVYVTGSANPNAGRSLYYSSQVTSSWDNVTQSPVITRGATGNNAIDVSYAVVEYTGINWNIQRAEHTYTTSGVAETESITPVNSLSRTFIHTQKRMDALGNVNNFGHTAWLSSIGAVSFMLEPAATTPSGHTSVVWIIENMQTSAGRMVVQRQGGTTTDGVEPVTIQINIGSSLAAVNNSSIFANAYVVGANTSFPLPMSNAIITSTTTYQLWRSEASALLTYRTELVEWPVHGLALRQNYYRFYVGNDSLLPTDAWPVGGVDLGENTSITSTDDPPGDGDNLRLRMSVRIKNANLPAGLYDFKLQYGLRVTSCSAIESWVDLGSSGSGSIWRGYNAGSVIDGTSLSLNPPTAGDLLLSISDISGSYIEQNPTPANPYLVNADNDVEYDWNIQHNGALSRSVYCFRMIYSDGTPLDGYLNYPQIYTSGFSPSVKDWQWYDDSENETPITPLASPNIAPTEVVGGNSIALRVVVGEQKNVLGTDIKFKLQYDENPNFTNPHDVVATSTCTATSTWCYSELSTADNTVVTTATLPSTDSCVAGVGSGCGTHNNSATYVIGHNQSGHVNAEYAFYVKPEAARVGAVYYFRPYEINNDQPAITVGTSTYPSLVAESARLVFTVGGLPSGTSTAGIITTATSTASAISFGSIPLDTPWYSAHRITIDTNATEGYQVLMYARQQLLNSYGTAIASVTGTNQAPTSWASGCSINADGCIGYHTADGSLAGGSTRFSALDTYSGLETSPVEVMYSSIPINDVYDIVYKVQVTPAQPAGTYETEIVYLAIPSY